ncbi:MAG: hypothetical protein ACLSDQ_07005 [Adlercreutzia equolifaciens]
MAEIDQMTRSNPSLETPEDMQWHAEAPASSQMRTASPMTERHRPHQHGFAVRQ